MKSDVHQSAPALKIFLEALPACQWLMTRAAGFFEAALTTKMRRAMKLTFLFLTAAFMSVGATGLSQAVTFSGKHVPVHELFSEVKKQTRFVFFYDGEIVRDTKPVTIHAKKMPLHDFLEQIFRDQPVEYSIVNRSIIVSSRKKGASDGIHMGAVLVADDIAPPVKGRVLTIEGDPVQGVSVMIKGTRKGVVSDENGRFEIDVESGQTLILSSVEFESAEMVVYSTIGSLEVRLVRKVIDLDETVVVGFGVQKKVNLTGSVATLSSKDLVNRPATSPMALMQGQMAGVYITAPTGLPGQESPSVLVRGVGTMNNSSPLIIVDGLETSTMNNINPNDIESISVLKDAAAAAIYGAAAGNGVILITTKRGSTGKPQVAYNNYFGVQKATRLPKNANSYDYALLRNEANRNAGNADFYSAAELEKFKNGSDPYNYPNTDWLHLLLQGSGFTQNHALSIAGGREEAKYRLSLEYFDQQGLMKRTSHQRYNIRINQDSKVNNWLDVSLNASLSKSSITSPVTPFNAGDAISQFFRQVNMIPPVQANKFEDGSYAYWSNGNPIAWLENGGSDDKDLSYILGSVSATIKLAEGLALKGVAGVDYNQNDRKIHVMSMTYGDGFIQGPNRVTDYFNRFMNTNLQAILNYGKTFGAHDVKIMAGTVRQSSRSSINDAYRQSFPSNSISQLNAGSTVGWGNSGSSEEDKLGSYFARVNYSLQNKYLFEANVRRDGSSRFARDKRWGTFPSFSIGWRIDQEHFMNDVSWAQNLKLRASWGKLGNYKIGYYQYIDLITLGQNYAFGGVWTDGAAITSASNPNITWETITEFDVGLDMDLFRPGLLGLTFDYYHRFTDDILTSVPVSSVFGLGAPTSNAGAMLNSGVEMQLDHNNYIGRFTYRLSANASFNKNVVKKFATPSKGSTIREVGTAWDSFYGYEWIGVFMSDAEAATLPHPNGSPVRAGDLRYRDQDGDGVIGPNDRVVLGNTIPKVTYGFSAGAGYQNFDLSVFFQGVGKVNRTLGGQFMFPFVEGGNASSVHFNRTIVEGDKVVKTGRWPRTALNGSNNVNTAMSSWRVYASDYLRLKNIQLGYTIPSAKMRKLGMTSARIYVGGENVLTITKFPDISDPEVSSGNGNYVYPNVAFYTAGLNITF